LGRTLVHEAAGIDGIRSTGDVEGYKDMHACSDIDLGSGSMAVHEDEFGREVEVNDRMLSDLESGTSLVVHKGSSEVAGAGKVESE
jgi:hypothetical protein